MPYKNGLYLTFIILFNDTKLKNSAIQNRLGSFQLG